MSTSSDLSELVAVAAAHAPQKTAIVEADGRSLTWAELDDQVTRVASGLAEMGLVAGHRVIISLPNRIEFVSAYFAILRMQAVAVPINPTTAADELAELLADCGARVAIGERRTLPVLREVCAADGVRLVSVDEAEAGEVSYADLLGTEPRNLPRLMDAERPAVLLYTAGTSGRPRAAMLSHRALLANLAQGEAIVPPMITTDDVVLGVLPLFHVYGLNGVLGGVVSKYAKLVLAERFETTGTLDLIEDEACSVLPLAPAVFPRWLALEDLDDSLGSVRLILSGSSALAGEVIEAFTARTGIAVHQGYGLTEAAPVVTSTICSETYEPGSLGAAIPGVELRLLDEHGEVLGDADPGAIQIKGANLFSGYWPDGADGPDADGWWSTGDLGFLDDDGNLRLVDRVSELIEVDGFKVYPQEVERVLAETPGVSGAAVIGVDGAVVAYVCAPGLDPETVIGEATERADTRLARFKRPARIEVVDELPLSITGKVQKGRLRGLERRRALELLAEGGLDSARPAVEGLDSARRAEQTTEQPGG